ncbi:TonB-dependent receptor [Congregibacter litoralis]|uniref:Outer membrane receptor protein, mostly Fe transport n=1 Tax=Congregibacter litoralis KT71 TaxID=314285 RepID=A4AD09_9GAMM|nr:TonB-dependent receptor [Congregibacter litoralis]EAQ96062.1 Outer membrane receptor protein, mostly Fe transport [Congregibacter litoralis KT71]
MSATFRTLPLIAAVSLATQSLTVGAQQLEEVIVTAQKRAESLQDVPISVSAVQGEKIQDAGIPNMAALADYVPNLHIADAPVNTNIYMRGVGSGNNQGFEQSVGMYIDGVYMGRGRQYRAGFLDVERVEVLRGPQGTLFGRNTVAGAINITTASARAGDEFEGQIMASAESFDGRIVEGFVGGGLTDTLGARLAVKYRETDGFADNTFLGTPEGGVEELSYRLSLNWQPTDNLNVNFKYTQSDYERTGSTTTGKVFLTRDERNEFVPNRSAFADTAYSIMDVFYPGYKEQTGREFEVFKDNGFGRSQEDGIGIGINPDSSDNDLTNMVLNVDWQVGELTLTSVTGWSEYQYIDGADVDWLPLQFISRDDDQSFEQVSQEFRIASPGGEFFDYVAGFYYDQSDLEFDRQVAIDTNFDGLFPEFLSIVTPGNPPPEVLPQNLLFALTQGAYDMNQVARNHNYQLDSDSLAVFAQGTFNFTDTLRLTVGVRYTEENKDVISTQFLSDQNSGLLNPGDSYFLHLIQANSFNAYAYDFREERSTDALTPSFNLQWDVGDDSMLYASFSQGFKSGGFTAADDQNPGDLAPTAFPCAPNPDFTVDLDACYDLSNPNGDFEFGDEEVDAFELGGKHTLLDGGMTLNWALFYTEYTDLQTAIFEGLGFVVKNAAGSEIYGLEVDALWQATDNLRLGANFAYLDASYSDFDDGPCTAIQLDANPNCSIEQGNPLSGEPTLYASDYSASFFFDYIRPVGQMEFFAGGEVNYRDSFQSAGDNDPIDQIDAFTKTNLRLGLRSGDWEIMAYGRNIFDEEVFMQSYDTPVLAGSHSRYMDESAVFGARLKYTF